MNTTNYLTTLSSFKRFAKIGASTTPDSWINQQLGSVAAQMETYTRRKLRGRLLTEYYDGGAFGSIITNQKPIISVTSVHDDVIHAYDATTLVAATDYVILADEGIIQLYDGSFHKGVKNVKVIYTAGYDEFAIITGINDKIDFEESDGVEITATLTAGVYTISSLLTHIKAKLEDAGAKTYTVSYSYTTGKITILGDTFLSLLWSSGTNAATSCGTLLGYIILANDTGAVTYTSDDSVMGVPNDLEMAANLILLRHYEESHYGSKRFDLKSKMVSGERGGTTSYVLGDLPPEAIVILNRYRKINV